MATLPGNLASLLTPQAYPHPVTSVALVETHISWVLLTGEFAYKIKRPVCYSFVDLRSPERRAFFCSEELRLNRRFAAELYVEVVEITASRGKASVAGTGPVIEHAVRMRQFEQKNELDRLLEAGRIETAALEAFGREIAVIHARLPVAQESQAWGRPEGLRKVLLENLEQCLTAAKALGTDDRVHALRQPYAARVAAAESCLDARWQGGRVRECHGDLHSRNIVQHRGRLIAFDCVEFDPAFRWIDVADEIAFLMMDLEARGFPLYAHAFRGGYLAQSGDFQACRMLGLYQAHRALVRAKITALDAAGAPPGPDRETILEQHRRYLAYTEQQLVVRLPKLLLMSGLSGSGKSWLAERLAPVLGAVHLRSDVERKRLAGLSERGHSDSALGQGLYSPRVSGRVYEHLAECAEHALAGEFTVIVDAAFSRRRDRMHFRDLAARAGRALQLIHCHAPRHVLEARIARRANEGLDASEADLSVLQWQQAEVEPSTDEEGIAVIDADTARPDVLAEVLDQLAGGRN
jgi:uncharacterized protein